jgi:ribonuclease HII
MARPRASRTLENAARRFGFRHVAGVDEVGRGCLAGPVMAAAVILDPDRAITGICDSKMITAAERERLYGVITRRALAWAVASAEPTEIDAINIHRASLQAMRRAVLALAPLPDVVLVDAFRIPDLLLAQRAVLHGDRRCTAIAAASIVAKVTRDRLMQQLGLRYPAYRWGQNAGYATPDHVAGLAEAGITPHHRRSFMRVRQLSLDFDVTPAPVTESPASGEADGEARSADETLVARDVLGRVPNDPAAVDHPMLDHPALDEAVVGEAVVDEAGRSDG